MTETINCKEAADRFQDYLPGAHARAGGGDEGDIERCRSCFESAQFERNFLVMLETRAARECCPDKLRQRILELLRAEARRG